MKDRLKKIGSCIVVVALIICSLGYLTDLLQRKASDEKYKAFFEEKNDFDVLFFGTSHVINGVFPMELWNDYGITSYNFGNDGSQLPTTYWAMKNALDYSTPKLVVLDGHALSGNTKTSFNAFSYVHTAMDTFPISQTKVDAVIDLLDDPVLEKVETEINSSEPRTHMGLLWDYSVYHSRWNDLKVGDFSVPHYPFKGALSRVAVCVPNEIIEIPTSSKWTGDSVGLKYLEKSIELCQERGIKVLLTYIPYPADENEHQQANRLYDVAEKYGVDYINFLNLDIVDYDTDCADANSHLNPSGAKKVTNYLGQYIIEEYGINDKRSMDIYDGWNEEYIQYKGYKIGDINSATSLDNYLMLLADKHLTSYVYIEENSELYQDDRMMKLLTNISLEQELEKLDEAREKGQAYLLVVDNKQNKVYEMVGDEDSTLPENIYEVIQYGKDENDNPYLYIQNDVTNYLSLHTKVIGEDGTEIPSVNDITVVVMDNETGEIINTSTFVVDGNKDGNMISATKYVAE